MGKRTYKTITCSDCHGPAKAPNNRTRYCRSCALGRAAQWHNGRPVACDCERQYINWTGGFKSCGHCFLGIAAQGGRESVQSTCKVCAQKAWVYTAELEVCWPCLLDPSNYEALRGSILTKYKSLLDKRG